MNILSVDTSTKIISAALLDDEKILKEKSGPYSKDKSMDLLLFIDEILKDAKKDIKDIELFCVGLGPGSFTGLRIGLTFTRCLALVLDKPIVGVESFDAIASNDFGDYKNICIVFDAKKKKVYARFYEREKNNIKPSSDFLLDSIEQVLCRIADETIIAGDAISVYKDEMSGYKKAKIKFAPEKLWYPKASLLGRLGLEKYKNGIRNNPYDLSPLYLYPKEC